MRTMPVISWFRDYSATSNEITRGLLDRYGPTRVVDTLIAQGMGAANSNMKSGGWIPEGSHYRARQKTIGSAKRGIGGMLLDTDKAPIRVLFMPTGIEAVIPIRAQFPRVGKMVTLGNRRQFVTVSESVSQKQSSQTKEKLKSPNHLRPLSPHLPIYKPQLNSTVSIFNRMSAAFLTAIFLSSYLICVK